MFKHHIRSFIIYRLMALMTTFHDFHCIMSCHFMSVTTSVRMSDVRSPRPAIHSAGRCFHSTASLAIQQMPPVASDGSAWGLVPACDCQKLKKTSRIPRILILPEYFKNVIIESYRMCCSALLSPVFQTAFNCVMIVFWTSSQWKLWEMGS